MANKNTLRNRKAGLFPQVPYDLSKRKNSVKRYPGTPNVSMKVVHVVPPIQKPGAGKIVKKFKNASK